VSTRTLLVVGVLVSLLLAGIGSFYSSALPDGLEFVAEQTGFAGSAREHAAAGSPFADYATRGVDSPRLSGGLAGVVGSVLVLVVAGGLFLLLRRRDNVPTRRGGD
jgi:cobalt/nickel transport system permease protein/cobalt/nickel transport protein